MALEVGTLNARIKVDTNGVSSSLNAVKRDLNDVKKSADKVEKNNIDVTPKGGDKVNSVSQSAKKLGDNLREAGTAGKGVSVNPQVASELDKASNSGGKLRGILSGLSNVAGLVGLGAAVGGVSAALGRKCRYKRRLPKALVRKSVPLVRLLMCCAPVVPCWIQR